MKSGPRTHRIRVMKFYNTVKRSVAHIKKMDSLMPSCVLDPAGTYKYIQINLKSKADSKLLGTVVRGFKRHGYHM